MSVAIHPTAFVDSGADLGVDVAIEPGAVIGPHVTVGDRTRIGSHTLITGRTRIGRDCLIHHGAVLGSPPQDLKYAGETTYLEVGDETQVREYVTVNVATQEGATTRVGSHCLLMAYSHVGHNSQVGNHVVLANTVQLAGFVTIEEWAIIGGLSAIHQFVRVGCHSLVGGGSRITQDVAPYGKLAGSPPRLLGINTIGLERRGFSRDTRAAIAKAHRILFRQQLTVEQATAKLMSEFLGIPEVEHLARFARTSARGLTR